MVLFPRDRNAPDHVAARPGVLPNLHDLAVFALLLALGVLLLHGAADMRAPLPPPGTEAVSLGLQHLLEYGLRTTLRMFAAMAASLLFTFVVATLAAKSRRAERLIVPALDILQSVPVLGFLTFTVTFFLGLFPGRQIGAELASIFAIFTSQAWNMATRSTSRCATCRATWTRSPAVSACRRGSASGGWKRRMRRRR
nr:hypothetical protein [Xanthomonas translucens]